MVREQKGISTESTSQKGSDDGRGGEERTGFCFDGDNNDELYEEEGLEEDETITESDANNVAAGVPGSPNSDCSGDAGDELDLPETSTVDGYAPIPLENGTGDASVLPVADSEPAASFSNAHSVPEDVPAARTSPTTSPEKTPRLASVSPNPSSPYESSQKGNSTGSSPKKMAQNRWTQALKHTNEEKSFEECLSPSKPSPVILNSINAKSENAPDDKPAESEHTADPSNKQRTTTIPTTIELTEKDAEKRYVVSFYKI